MTGDTDDRAAVLDAELRVDAVDVLTDALQWRLTEARWTVVGPVVDALAAAVRAGDAAATEAAVAELELLGRVRATPSAQNRWCRPPSGCATRSTSSCTSWTTPQPTS